jgi:molybdopterin/thiamine biosynthesis adenylyltransferase
MRRDRCTVANVSSIGKVGQRRLSVACVGVAGLGGVGGIAFELLVRAGVGKVKISDSGFFEESNANRQSLWTRGNDGRKKITAAKDFARGVNPGCSITAFPDITLQNTSRFASGCSAVIDATDRRHSRLAVWKGCKREKTPYIFASALGTTGMLTVFAGGPDFESQFGMKGQKYSDFISCDHSLGPVANTMGCLAAQQAINTILNKPALQFPCIISLDAFSPHPITIHRF